MAELRAQHTDNGIPAPLRGTFNLLLHVISVTPCASLPYAYTRILQLVRYIYIYIYIYIRVYI